MYCKACINHFLTVKAARFYTGRLFLRYSEMIRDLLLPFLMPNLQSEMYTTHLQADVCRDV